MNFTERLPTYSEFPFNTNKSFQNSFNLIADFTVASVSVSVRGFQKEETTKVIVTFAGTAGATGTQSSSPLNYLYDSPETNDIPDNGVALQPNSAARTVNITQRPQIFPLYDSVNSIQGYLRLNVDGTFTANVVNAKIYDCQIVVEF